MRCKQHKDIGLQAESCCLPVQARQGVVCGRWTYSAASSWMGGPWPVCCRQRRDPVWPVQL